MKIFPLTFLYIFGFLAPVALADMVGVFAVQYEPTAYEQYVLELTNRARANPQAEVTRLSGQVWGNTGSPAAPNLNEGLASGTISTSAKQPLTFNTHLIQSSRNYSSLCLSTNGWGHNVGGTDPGQRMTTAGYVFSGTWSWGENIAWSGSTGAQSVSADFVGGHYDNFFIDGNVAGRGHRLSLMNSAFKEIGVGVAAGGNYNGGFGGTLYNAVFTTMDFAMTAGDSFLTGVVYKDLDNDKFYTPGEGIGGVTITATPVAGGSAHSITTWSSGGYTLQLAPGTYSVSASGTPGNMSLGTVVISTQNVKLDAVYTNSVTPSPVLSVQQPIGTNLTSGSSIVDFGPVASGSSAIKTFTIKNSGTASLTLGTITKDGNDAGQFSLTSKPSSTVAPGNSTTFNVTFTPSGLGARSAMLHLPSNDLGSPSFDIPVTATGSLAATSPATAVTSGWATLNGTANPNGQATAAYFQYGTSTGYGSKTLGLDLGSGTASVPVSLNLSGLAKGTTYHYRLVINSGGTVYYGADQSLVTPPTTSPAAWHSNQITDATAFAPMAPGNRTGAVHGTAPRYYFKSTDNHIWSVYFASGGVAWSQAALTSIANASDWLTFMPGYDFVYYKGTDNNLWVLWNAAGVWNQSPLTTNMDVGGDIAVDTSWRFAYYRTPGNDLEVVWFGENKWNQSKLTTLPGLIANVAGGISVDSASHFIYYRGTDSKLWVVWFGSGKWNQAALTSTANVGGAVTADSGNFIYYRSSLDNTVWCVWFAAGKWNQSQLDSGALVLASSSSPASIFALNYLFYLDRNGQLEDEYFDGTKWSHAMVGDGGSGLTGALSVQQGTHWAFAQRNDGTVVIFYYQ